MYTFIPYTNCPAFSQWLPCNAASHPGPEVWCKHLCSGPVDAQRLPRLRRLLHKLSAIGCRVLDRICTRLYLTQIARRSANGHRTMQFRILARKCGVNTYALARRTTASFTLQSFASFWKSPYILSFAYIPSTQSLKAAKSPLRFPGAGILLFAKGAPFAQFTKMSTKDGWAMLLWVHSAFRTIGVSCKSVLPSTVAQLNGLCLLLALQHLTNGYRAMQFRILAR